MAEGTSGHDDLTDLGSLLLARAHGDDSAATTGRILGVLVPAAQAAPDDTVLILRLRTPVARLEHHRSLLTRRTVAPSTGDLAAVADAVGLLTEADVAALLAALRPVDRGGLQRQRIHRLVEAGRLEDAHDAADALGDPLRGHRDVALHLARKGEVDAFFDIWPRLQPRRATKELVELREELVATVARHRGWEAAVELVDSHPRLGDRYLFAALSARHIADYEHLPSLLDGDLGASLTEVERVRLLVDELLCEHGHFGSGHAAPGDASPPPAAPQPPEDPRILPLAERIGALEGDRGTLRARDWQLTRLWPLVAEAATLARIRALVRAPQLRRELSVLARDA